MTQILTGAEGVDAMQFLMISHLNSTVEVYQLLASITFVKTNFKAKAQYTENIKLFEKPECIMNLVKGF